MNRFLPILGMISLLVLGGCTAARNIGSISEDEWGSLGDCSARSNYAGVLGSPDSVIKLDGAGTIELHEFSMKPHDASSKASAAFLAVFGLGMTEFTDELRNKEGSPNYTTCISYEEANLECAYAKGVMFTHYAGDGRDEKPFCRGLKVVQMGVYDNFKEYTTCPPVYRNLLAGEIDTNGFPDGYEDSKPSPPISRALGPVLLAGTRQVLKAVRDKRCK